MSISSIVFKKNDDPKKKEDLYVHKVYDEISNHFSVTRHTPWPKVKKFLNDQKKFSFGLDIGCGNGKYLDVNKNLFIIGVDRCQKLLEKANSFSKGYNLCHCDSLALPLKDNFFDFAISIAVIHHFSTENRRIDAIREILKKLKTNSQLLIFCWALEQENSRRGFKKTDEQDILVPWVLINESNNNESLSVNQIKSKKNQDNIKYRYYHLFKEGELIDIALKTKCCNLISHGYEKDNWWVIVEKI